MSAWIFDASPLILLGKTGCLPWLQVLPPSFMIPASVRDEILAGPEDDAARNWIEDAAVRPLLVDDVAPLPNVLAWDLGAGETAVKRKTTAHESDHGWRGS